MSYAWTNMQMAFSFIILSKLIVALISASLFMIAIMNFASGSSFYITSGAYYVITLVNEFRDYAKYPISIFKGFLRFVFTFIIPIGFMAYYPSLEFLTNKEPTLLTYLTPVYGILFFYLSYKFWMRGAYKYSGTGS